MSTREHFHGVVAALQPVVQGVPESTLGDATPCTELDVRGLVAHLLGTSEAMRRLGAGEPLDPQDPWGTRGAEVTATWRKDLSQRLIALADAWQPEAAWDGTAMDGAMERSLLGKMAYVELVAHGWDLAVATGQGVELTEPQVAAFAEVMAEIGETGRSMGAFGPQVAVDDDAPAFDHALAAAGRDTDWSG